jgi:alpha-L-rhamnosidase
VNGVNQTDNRARGGGGIRDDEGVEVVRLRIEHRRDNLGIGTANPRLSWNAATERKAWVQAAYEIAAVSADGKVQSTSGRVASAESVLVSWPFAPLQSREERQIQVRIWGTDGSASPWSAPVAVEAGLLSPDDWSARFITPDWNDDQTTSGPSPLLRREFAIGARVVRARLYTTALGVYDVRINGERVGDEVLAPGWTSYRHRLHYSTFDVTSLLHTGPNVVGAILGDGWYRGRFGFGGGRRNLYGDRLALLAQLEITYEDGTIEVIVTDASWHASTGPIHASDIYDGETYDARLERDGWAAPGFDASDWRGVTLLAEGTDHLDAPVGPPVRRAESLAPAAILQSPSGKTLVDFGQNLVGRVRFAVEGEAGQEITLRHAEVLEDGELGVRPLRTALATDRYILRGGGPETWEPLFTFHGFRYVEVTGWPGELQQGDLEAIVLTSDLERTGWFTCSDPQLEQFHENVIWSMRGNFLSIPTDCPQRDERLGWTGDIQVFAPTASFLGDVAGFLQSWLVDLAAEQRDAGGVVPNIVPNVLEQLVFPGAAWGDAAAIVPWVLYERYGDASIFETQFESMSTWVDTIARIAGDDYLWDEGFQFGDWLDPDAPPDKPAAGKTNPHLVATAYFAYSARLTGEAARVIGRAEQATHYLELAARVKRAFAAAYLQPDGSVGGVSTTPNALALHFDLVPDDDARRSVGKRLAELVRESDYRISTGFVGTPIICDALCAVGEYETAYRLLMQRECPSWLYPVTMGATTIWERWDSMRPDGSINPGEMTSFNHYALGAVADWMHRVVGGLAPAEPGYKRLLIQPVPGGGLTHATARHQTPYGPAECRWEAAGDTLRVDVCIPPNASAEVVLPDGTKPGRERIEVGSGRHTWTIPWSSLDAARSQTDGNEA